MRNSNTGLSHGTSGSPQESIESLEYEAKVQEIEAKLKEELEQQEYPKESLSNLSNTERFTEGAIKHIFEGEVNNRGKAVGYHYEGVENTTGEVVAGTKTIPDRNGVYEANVIINGVSKRGGSTFFPREWSPQQVVNAVNEAYAVRYHIPPQPNRFEGRLSSGLKVQMFLDDGRPPKIRSAFPVKESI